MSYDPIFKLIGDFPGSGRQYGFAGAYDRRGYYGGGNDSGYYADFYEFDSRYNTWTQKNGPGTARTRAAAVATNQALYVMCGYNGSYLNSMQAYDFATGIWGDRTAFGGSIRSDIVAVYCAANGKIYAGLGYDGSSFYADWYEYTPGTNAWASKTACNLAGGRMQAFAFCIGTKIYVGGGSNGSGGDTGHGEISVYDVNMDTWTSLTAMSLSTFDDARSCVPVVIHDDLVVMFGGETRIDTMFFHGWAGIGGMVFVPSENSGAGGWHGLDTSYFPDYVAPPSIAVGHNGFISRGRVIMIGGYSQPIITSIFYGTNVYLKSTNSWSLDQGLRIKDPDTDAVTRIAMEFPNYTQSPLRIGKNGKVFGVSLVPTDSDLATSFRVQTDSGGVQALEKIPEDD